MAGIVRTPEQIARYARDRARLAAARDVLNWTVVGNDVSGQLAAVRAIAAEAEGFGASDALTQAANLWNDGDHPGAYQAIDDADASLALIAEPAADEKASLLARFASSSLGTKIIETGATANALVGIKTKTYSGADDKLVSEAEARAAKLKLGLGLGGVVVVILALMYWESL